MNRKVFLRALVVIAGVLLINSALAQPTQEPTQLVQRTTERMLQTLAQRRAEIEANPNIIYRLVGENLIPHFAFDRITQAAVGVDWRQTTPAQQQALIEAFREVLVRTYATALLKYSGQDILYQPARPGNRSGTVIVSTQVRAPGSASIPIDYRLLQQDGRWQVYDVVIENVSLITNYRSQFRAIIGRSGIDGLIRELRSKNLNSD